MIPKSVTLSLCLAAVSLHAQVVLNEVMFNPTGPENTDEFVEIVNIHESESVDLNGWQIGDAEATDPLQSAGYGLILNPGQYCLILDPDYLESSGTYDPLISDSCLILTLSGSTFGSGGFSNSRPESVHLFDDSGNIRDTHTYSVEITAGHSSERKNTFDLNGPAVWGKSHFPLGTPGFENSIQGNSFSPIPTLPVFEKNALVINEIYFQAMPGEPEWVELFNPGTGSINISGWSISDSDTSRARQISGMADTLSPGGYAVVAADSSLIPRIAPQAAVYVLKSFPGLNNDQDQVTLMDPGGSIIDQVAYDQDMLHTDYVSLERVCPLAPSEDRANWVGCTDLFGNTPGARNSVTREGAVRHCRLSVSPNPFSPDGDGLDDVALVSYSIPETVSLIKALIFDVPGRLVRTLRAGSPGGSSGKLVWDGRDDAGKPVDLGIYIVYFESYREGGVFRNDKTTVIVAGKL